MRLGEILTDSRILALAEIAPAHLIISTAGSLDPLAKQPALKGGNPEGGNQKGGSKQGGYQKGRNPKEGNHEGGRHKDRDAKGREPSGRGGKGREPKGNRMEEDRRETKGSKGNQREPTNIENMQAACNFVCLFSIDEIHKKEASGGLHFLACEKKSRFV